MAVTAPDWLTKRGGEVRPTSDGQFCVVVFDGNPQYRLRAIPTAGKHSCEVEQLNNGKRRDSGATFPNADDAVRGGLDELRKLLGW